MRYSIGLGLLTLYMVTVLSCKDNTCNWGNTHNADLLVTLLNEPSDEFVAINCDKPWEQELSFPVIIKVDNHYNMYYGTYTGYANDRNRYFALCLATSSDGINWIKPNLGICSFEGDFDTNIISYEIEGFSIEKKDNVYYLISYSTDYFTKLYKSSDGIHFEKIPTFHIPYCCDSPNQLLYNEDTGVWNIYLRSWYKSENNNILYNHTDSLYRNVSVATTNDIENFEIELSKSPFYRWGADIPPALSNELPMVFEKNTTTKDFDIYNSCIHQYNDTCYLAYPIHYYHTPEISLGGNYNNDGYSTIALYHSRDGFNFELVTDNYITPTHAQVRCYCEFGMGHYEDKESYIHYWINFNKTHGDPNYRKNSIQGRKHYKR